MTWQPDVVVYHFPCDDGLASAWICREMWGEDSILWRPTDYGQAFSFTELANKKVLVCDFSWKGEELETALEMAHSIVFLDHHKTAEETLSRHPRIRVLTEGLRPADVSRYLSGAGQCALAVFDMDKSGARLTWEFCHGAVEPPEAIKFIEDRDLWRFKYEQTKAHSLWLRSFPMDFAAWTKIMTTPMSQWFDEGQAIKRFYSAKIDEILESAVEIVDEFAGYGPVGVVHTNWVFVSDACHRMLELYPEIEFAAAVVQSHGGRTISLRSTDDRVDVSEVAKHYGGGGHRNAAGFRLPI